MLEVGVNGLLLDSPHSGSAVYTLNLLKWLPVVASDMRFRVFVRTANPKLNNVTVDRRSEPISRRGGAVAARTGKLVWETLTIPLAAKRTQQDLLHNPYFAAPPIRTVHTVVTVHDVIPLVLPDYHRSPSSRFYSRFMARTVGKADGVITVSEHARDDILRVLDVSPHKVFVTPEAAGDEFSSEAQEDDRERLEKYDLPDRFVLYLGGAERRKNIETLVRAWKDAAPDVLRLECKLVIVADFPFPDVLYPDIAGLIRDLDLQDNVKVIAAVDERDKAALYRAALAFCFPSLYEGFGLPPLEAMASGLPVLASNATSLPEVLGDAAWLLEPRNISAWSRAISEIVQSEKLRASLRTKGLERAKQFSWRRTAMQTAEIYRQVLSR